MIEIISHRGNLLGPTKSENSPKQIEKALKVFKVEVDVWYDKDKWFLGHDVPTYEVSPGFFDKNMFLHCKNIKAVEQLYETHYNWFWHEKDAMTLTSLGEIWCYPGHYIKNGITMVKEKIDSTWKDTTPSNIKGLCTDYPLNLKEMINGF